MDNYQFSFEKLEVWKMARELTKEIFIITRTFPSEEKFSLVLQISRSATSICANLAEGSARLTPKDQAHFTVISVSSMIELLNHLIISHDLNYINQETLLKFRTMIQPLSARLSSLKKSQLARITGLNKLLLILFSYSIYKPLLPLNL